MKKTKRLPNMQKGILFSLLLCVAFLCQRIWNHYHAASHTAHNMQEVHRLVLETTASYDPQDVLCCIDLDDTLLWLDYKPAYPCHQRKYRQLFQKQLQAYPGVTKQRLYFLLSSYVRLTDPDFLSLRPSFPPKTIAFTASGTGTFGTQPMTAFRYQELQRLGVSFASAFPFSSLVLEKLTCEDGLHPEYYQGILFSSRILDDPCSKGAVLCEFLHKTSWQPKCVLLIDDRRTNHASVRKFLRKQFPSVKFVGLLYQGNFRPKDSVCSPEEFQTAMETLCKQAASFIR